jgi:hypothetical protein
MTEQERQEIKKNPLASLESRPMGCKTEDWKNRFRISAKLARINYTSAFIFFTRMGWSWSSGINHLIATNPEIQQIQKELQNNA